MTAYYLHNAHAQGVYFDQGRSRKSFKFRLCQFVKGWTTIDFRG